MANASDPLWGDDKGELLDLIAHGRASLQAMTDAADSS